jgi:hypothetical protein
VTLRSTSPRSFRTTLWRSARERQSAPELNDQTQGPAALPADEVANQRQFDQPQYALTAPAEPIERAGPQSGRTGASVDRDQQPRPRWRTARQQPRNETAPAEDRWSNQPFFPFVGPPSAEESRVASVLPNRGWTPEGPPASSPRVAAAPPSPRPHASAPRSGSRSVAQERAASQSFSAGAPAQRRNDEAQYRYDARSQRLPWRGYDQGDWGRQDRNERNGSRMFGGLFGD